MLLPPQASSHLAVWGTLNALEIIKRESEHVQRLWNNTSDFKREV